MPEAVLDWLAEFLFSKRMELPCSHPVRPVAGARTKNQARFCLTISTFSFAASACTISPRSFGVFLKSALSGMTDAILIEAAVLAGEFKFAGASGTKEAVGFGDVELKYAGVGDATLVDLSEIFLKF